MLRVSAVGAALTALPRPPGSSGSALVPSHRTNATTYQFTVGDFAATVLLTGSMENTPAQPSVAPQATPQEFGAALAAASSNGRFRLHFLALLLQRGQENILIDAGPGGNAAPEHDLVAHLRRLGLQPRDITAVLLTHAHFDHLGGLLDARDRIVFSAAEHFCMGEEIDFWLDPQADFSRMGFKPQPMVAQARRVFERVHFTRIAPTVRLPAGLTAIHAPGHTPGQMTVRIESGGESLYHIADLTHYARLMLPHPDWTIASDVDPRQAAATRRRIFRQLAATRTRVFGSHLPFPGLGALQARGDGFEWIAEDWS